MLKYQEFILESKLNNYEVESVDEGVKTIITFLLGMATAGTSLGQSSSEINQNLKDPTFVQQANNFINDQQKMKELKDIVGVEYYNKIVDNKGKIEGSLDKKHKEVTNVVSIKDTNEIKSYLSRGWSPTDIKITKDTIITTTEGDVIEFEIRSSYPNNAVFKTGSYDLTEDFKSNLDSLISTLEIDPDRDLTHITIETSTDKEPIAGGNKKLSENRAESVSGFLNTIVSDIEISTDIKYDQGDDIYSKGMSKDERDSARSKTSEFRYVKIKVFYIESGSVKEPATTTTIEENELIVFKKMTKIHKKRKHYSLPNFQIKMYKLKRGGNSYDCIID
jgi:outer membrane protein OmpA-like peptidoglycan-associated protein